ncbi:dicer-like protein 4 isoform X2 [Arachis duranensis]|uniref:Dicer-like protein 4 isoform X2 n=1 Tax=Arachis duranensis TaxID=130453 RepID=A0A9C6WUK2_ARADU|nr:dicer-like protein 4 isoform X2 [Arachis duranensis]
MLVPSPFKKSWKNEEKVVHLNSHYIKFCPFPEDRVYEKFGLFIMPCLPTEAEKLELDLHLAHGRFVISTFVPFGVVEFEVQEVFCYGIIRFWLISYYELWSHSSAADFLLIMLKFQWGCTANVLSFSSRTCKLSTGKYEILDMEIYGR